MGTSHFPSFVCLLDVVRITEIDDVLFPSHTPKLKGIVHAFMLNQGVHNPKASSYLVSCVGRSNKSCAGSGCGSGRCGCGK
eukprot:3123515-Amphidinium_carterae.2